ncbi:MAG TPA: hypothetical protein DCY93_01950, partial [Firmicutes bacterium]|nr:hypothetical protein [Bacillota bacterium]
MSLLRLPASPRGRLNYYIIGKNSNQVLFSFLKMDYTNNMCARVEINFEHPVYSEIKQRLLKKYPNLNILSSDYFPSQSLPLIYLQDEYDVGMFSWGYNNLKNKQKIINARA